MVEPTGDPQAAPVGDLPSGGPLPGPTQAAPAGVPPAAAPAVDDDDPQAAAVAGDDSDVWDFSLPDRPKRFKFNGSEVYSAPAVLPPATMRKLAALRGQLADNDAVAKFDQICDVFSSILTTESAARFRERWESVDDPVDLQRQLLPCLWRLMEAYGLRPTQPSSPSADGGGETVTSLTVGQHPAALIQNPSQPIAGSTSSTTGS